MVDERGRDCGGAEIEEAQDPALQVDRHSVEAEVGRDEVEHREPDERVAAALQELSCRMPDDGRDDREQEDGQDDEQQVLLFRQMLQEDVVERCQEQHQDVAGDEPVLLMDDGEQIERVKLVKGEDVVAVFQEHDEPEQQVDAERVREELEQQAEDASGAELRRREEVPADEHVAAGGSNGKGIEGAGDCEPDSCRTGHDPSDAEEMHGDDRQHGDDTEKFDVRLSGCFLVCQSRSLL